MHPAPTLDHDDDPLPPPAEEGGFHQRVTRELRRATVDPSNGDRAADHRHRRASRSTGSPRSAASSWPCAWRRRPSASSWRPRRSSTATPVYIASTIVVTTYATVRSFRPIRYTGDMLSLIEVIVEVALHVAVVDLTGGWGSPVRLLVHHRGLHRRVRPRLRLRPAHRHRLGRSPSACPTVLGPDVTTDDRSRSAARGRGMLILVSIVAGYARRISGEADRQRDLALDRLGRLADANALLYSLHRVAQTLPAVARPRRGARLDRRPAARPVRLRLRSSSSLFDDTDGHWAGRPPARACSLPEPPRPDRPARPACAARSPRAASSRCRTCSATRRRRPRRPLRLGPLRRRSPPAASIIGPHRPRAPRAEPLHRPRRRAARRASSSPLALAIDNARWFARLRTVGADEERTRIARDLHDRIGQSLAYLAFELDRIVTKDQSGDERRRVARAAARRRPRRHPRGPRHALRPAHRRLRRARTCADDPRASTLDRVARAQLASRSSSTPTRDRPPADPAGARDVAHRPGGDHQRRAPRQGHPGPRHVALRRRPRRGPRGHRQRRRLRRSAGPAGSTATASSACASGPSQHRRHPRHRLRARARAPSITCVLDPGPTSTTAADGPGPHRAPIRCPTPNRPAELSRPEDHDEPPMHDPPDAGRRPPDAPRGAAPVDARRGLRRRRRGPGRRSRPCRLADELRPDVDPHGRVDARDCDGVEATRQIKSHGSPTSKIVMLTMHADKEVLTDAIRAGASGYLVKDCSTEEIAEAVRMAAGGDTALSPQLAQVDARRGAPARRDGRAPRRSAMVTKREEEVLQLIADGCSTPEVAEQPLHQPEDGEEPPGVDLPEARRPRPHAGRPAGRPHGHRPPRLTSCAGARRCETAIGSSTTVRSGPTSTTSSPVTTRLDAGPRPRFVGAVPPSRVGDRRAR